MDLETLKNRLEVSEGQYSSQHIFQMVDIQNLKYLDIQGIQVYMDQYFKHMINKQNLGMNPFSIEGTGLYYDSRPEFYEAIMRRLGVDTAHKINCQEFEKMIKPIKPDNIRKLMRTFGD